ANRKFKWDLCLCVRYPLGVCRCYEQTHKERACYSKFAFHKKPPLHGRRVKRNEPTVCGRGSKVVALRLQSSEREPLAQLFIFSSKSTIIAAARYADDLHYYCTEFPIWNVSRSFRR